MDGLISIKLSSVIKVSMNSNFQVVPRVSDKVWTVTEAF